MHSTFSLRNDQFRFRFRYIPLLQFYFHLNYPLFRIYSYTRYVLFFPPSVHLSSFCVFLVSRQNIRAFEYLWSKSKKYTIRILRVAFLQEISRMKRSFEENARHRSTRAITRSEEARNLVVTGYLRNLDRTREISVSRAILKSYEKTFFHGKLEIRCNGKIISRASKDFRETVAGSKPIVETRRKNSIRDVSLIFPRARIGNDPRSSYDLAFLLEILFGRTKILMRIFLFNLHSAHSSTRCRLNRRQLRSFFTSPVDR